MSSVLDNSLVGLALLVSVGYAIASLGPRGLKSRVSAALIRGLAPAPAFLGLRRLAQHLANAATGQAQAACGGCDNCGSEASGVQKSQAEVSVPVREIGRRISDTRS
ncbi:MAG: hypothetical protein M3N50_03095 [Pseudomonadota bacterium]|nr:hypothetical protein [Pseudomonadota bacterium]